MLNRWLLFRAEEGGAADSGGASGASDSGADSGAEGAPSPPSGAPAQPSGEGGGQQGTPSPSPTTQIPDGWKGPSQQEWNTLVAAVHQAWQQLTPQEQEEIDFDSMSPDQLVQFAVDQRLQGLAPVLEHAQRQAGEARMNKLFDDAEKQIGKFDRELASRIANGLFYEVGDPVKAVQMGAQEAKRIREEFGKQAVEDYKSTLKKPNFDDPEFGSAGHRLAEGAKTYEEVIAKWSGEEEV